MACYWTIRKVAPIAGTKFAEARDNLQGARTFFCLETVGYTTTHITDVQMWIISDLELHICRAMENNGILKMIRCHV